MLQLKLVKLAAAVGTVAALLLSGGCAKQETVQESPKPVAAAPAVEPPPPPRAAPPPPREPRIVEFVLPNTGQHTIARGETLFSIAKQYGCTVNGIAKLNNIKNPAKIKIGQVLNTSCI